MFYDYYLFIRKVDGAVDEHSYRASVEIKKIKGNGTSLKLTHQRRSWLLKIGCYRLDAWVLELSLSFFFRSNSVNYDDLESSWRLK